MSYYQKYLNKHQTFKIKIYFLKKIKLFLNLISFKINEKKYLYIYFIKHLKNFNAWHFQCTVVPRYLHKNSAHHILFYFTQLQISGSPLNKYAWTWFQCTTRLPKPYNSLLQICTNITVSKKKQNDNNFKKKRQINKQ